MRYFVVYITTGTSPGPFNIYNNSEDYPTNANLSDLYDSDEKAEGLTYEQLTGGNSVIIETPDDISAIIVYDTLNNLICESFIFEPECVLNTEIINITELTPQPTNSDCQLFIPIKFTPNDDDVNDTFEIVNLNCYPINEMFIYSGITVQYLNTELVFHTKSYHVNTWNGKRYNIGNDCGNGFYTWVLYINGEIYNTGTVSLGR